MTDITVDIAVVGSGAAGLTAAVTGAIEGAQVCVLEKAGLFGGTTAVSGGLTWVPNNHHMADVGIEDSPQEALGYIERNTLGRGDRALIAHYISEAPKLVHYLEDHGVLDFNAVPRYPDYHPEFEGGKAGGRAIEGPLFDTTSLGTWADKLRRSPVFGRTPMRVSEATQWGAFANPFGVPFEEIMGRAKRGIVGRGAALIGHLLKGCLDRKVQLHLNTAARKLRTDNERVVGLLARGPEGEVRINAKGGVILASGGYEWSEAFVRAFMNGALTHPNTPPQCEGDGLRMAMSVGAELGNMGEAWWAPSMVIPGETYDGAPLYRADFAVRTLPHSIIVNRAGKRFVNEALNYNDLMKPFFDVDPNTMVRTNLPAWSIVDQQFLDKYFYITAIPGHPAPDYVTQADTIETLACTLGIDDAALVNTVERFNRFAVAGIDDDFARGQSAYDTFYGDPKHTPNPCLGTLHKPPFYAIELKPGALGTKGGPRTDVDGRVLHVNGDPIEGLYAAGNVAASLAGAGYPGPGITIGAALLWGHLSAMHATKRA